MTLGTRESFSQSVERIFNALFVRTNTANDQFHAKLTASLIDCFHLKVSPPNKIIQAELILNHLFGCFSASASCPFHLVNFLRNYTSRIVKKRLINALLYSLYFKDIDLGRYQHQNHWETLELLMFQLLAENASRVALKKILKKLPLVKQLALLCFAIKNYREGSYIIISEFESLFLQRRPRSPSHKVYEKLHDLLLGMRSHYYDRRTVYHELESSLVTDEQFLDRLIDKLKNLARRQAKTLQNLFKALIPLMIDSPVKVYDAIENLKKSLPENNYHSSAQERERAEEQRKVLQQRFASYLNASYNVKDFQKFAKVFGFTGQYPFLKIMEKPLNCDSLIEKVSLMHNIFNEPLTLSRMPGYEIVNLFDFALAMTSHLEAICRTSNAFTDGLHLLTCAITTKGKLLSKQASLTSLIKGLQRVSEYSNKDYLKNYPIYVFDQSLPAIFNKNRRFINLLNHQYKSSIIHISKEESLEIARKISIDMLLNTTLRGDFGFGGARNCEFLLTPFLRTAYAQGLKSMDAVLEVESNALKKLFQQSILENDSNGKGNSNSELLIDDDMEIPEANIFSHLLYARGIRHIYTCYCGFCYGRGTKYSLKFPFLRDVLKSATNNFAFTEWVNIPFYAPMPQYIGKPKICLNLPFGHEENHIVIPWTVNLMLQGAYHLGGTRYPNKQTPTHWIVGLAQHLESYLPYSLGIYLSGDLINPSNNSGRCILPWNDGNKPINFFSLKDCLTIIAETNTKEEIQRRYWRNVHDLFDEEASKNFSLRQCIDDLVNTDVDDVLANFRNKLQKAAMLNPIENNALEKIGKIYKFFKRDANLFNHFGSQALTGIKFTSNIREMLDEIKIGIEKQQMIRLEDYPITYGFYLTCHSVGTGQFSAIIQQILTYA